MNLGNILGDYMLQRLAWVERLTQVVLRDTNISIEDYIDGMRNTRLHR